MKRKKIVAFVMVVGLCISFVSGAGVTTTNAAKSAVKLSKKNVTLQVGTSKKISLKKAKAAKVKWSSSNKKVATVKKGKIKAISRGTATITAKYKKKKYKCKVKVVNSPKQNIAELKDIMIAQGTVNGDSYFIQIPDTFILIYYYPERDKLEFSYNYLSSEWGDHSEMVMMSLIGETPEIAEVEYELYDETMNGSETTINEYKANTSFYINTMAPGVNFKFLTEYERHEGKAANISQYYDGQAAANRYLQNACAQWNVALESLSDSITLEGLGFSEFK